MKAVDAFSSSDGGGRVIPGYTTQHRMICLLQFLVHGSTHTIFYMYWYYVVSTGEVEE